MIPIVWSTNVLRSVGSNSWLLLSCGWLEKVNLNNWLLPAGRKDFWIRYRDLLIWLILHSRLRQQRWCTSSHLQFLDRRLNNFYKQWKQSDLEKQPARHNSSAMPQIQVETTSKVELLEWNGKNKRVTVKMQQAKRERKRETLCKKSKQSETRQTKIVLDKKIDKQSDRDRQIIHSCTDSTCKYARISYNTNQYFQTTKSLTDQLTNRTAWQSFTTDKNQ